MRDSLKQVRVDSECTSIRSYMLWKGLSNEILCVQFSFCFLRLQFHFSNYVIASYELPYINSFGQRMLLKT